MEDMLKDFVVEALELATNVEEHLLSLERYPDDKQTLNAVFRSFHTIKGGAGFMNLPAMVSACHLTENLFDALRNGKAPLTPLAIEAALQASGFVANQLTELANGAAPGELSPMPAELESILNDAIEGKAEAVRVGGAPGIAVSSALDPDPLAADAGAAGWPAATPQASPLIGEPDWRALFRAIVPPGTLADDDEPALAAIGTLAPSGSGTTASTPPHATPVPAAARITEATEATEASLASTANAATAAPAASGWDGVDRRGSGRGAPVKEDSIRVDAIKLDALLEVAGESVQAANQAAVLLEKLMQFKYEDSAAALMANLAETLSRASRYSTELQRATLSTRMQPVGRLFQKFPRLVRELAKELGKDVELLIEGAETEVDRVVVDSLYDPLVHMLRNSLDHGIEDAATRAAQGKPAKGTISLKAWQEGSGVMIELSDDGKGLDAGELRNKARKKGLIDEFTAHTDDEAFQLVFLPGFSTREQASSVSGRGVGMDVVKTAVVKHRGTIHIESALGKGTRFSIRLPIELSIVPTLLVRTAGAALAMPMEVVQRVVELPEHFESVAGQPMMRDQGRPLPVRSLAGVLCYTPGTERVGIVMAAPRPYILAVDLVEGTADLVVKPLTALSVPGVTGTARSAEGELVLMIGLSFLLDGCRAVEAHAA